MNKKSALHPSKVQPRLKSIPVVPPSAKPKPVQVIKPGKVFGVGVIN